jgi:hypothetical protein
VGTDQSVTFAQAANLPNTFGFKNRFINGNMAISQRGTGAFTPADGDYTLDRWVCGLSQASKFTVQQTPSATETGFATRVAAGFTNYLACTVGASANVTIGAGDVFAIQQKVEGFNFADMAWGTSAAKTVTLSFLAYSSVTGTFGGAMVNSANNRSYPFTYSIPTANTWTTISVTIAGDTTGTWVGATNGIGAKIWFSLGAGSSGLNTAGAWVGANSYSATGAVSPITTNSATFYITGVQLEKGSTATSFDYRPYTTELQLCQRYYNRWSGANSPYIGLATALLTGGTAPAARRATWANPVDFRSQPTMGSGGTIQFYTAGLTNLQFSSFNGTQSNKNIISIDINSSSAGTVGQSGMLVIDSTSAANFIDASAEL